MHGINTQHNGYLTSQVIARIISDRLPDHPDTMRHLAAIERIEARGIAYRGEDFNVLCDALDYLRTVTADAPLDPPGYALHVALLEAEGMSTSDAQGVADLEFAAV